jgi:hypothetical protein
MRSHGVTNFPDPPSHAAGKSETIDQSGVDANSPAYRTAAGACQKYEPRTGNNTSQGQTSQSQTQQLKFAECMRKHGVPNFPESPGNSSGQHSITNYGINPNTPTFRTANSACSSLLSGGS